MHIHRLYLWRVEPTNLTSVYCAHWANLVRNLLWQTDWLIEVSPFFLSPFLLEHAFSINWKLLIFEWNSLYYNTELTSFDFIVTESYRC